MKRLIYSSLEERTPRKQAEINYLLQKKVVKRKEQELEQLNKELEQEIDKLNQLKKIYKSY